MIAKPWLVVVTTFLYASLAIYTYFWDHDRLAIAVIFISFVAAHSFLYYDVNFPVMTCFIMAGLMLVRPFLGSIGLEPSDVSWAAIVAFGLSTLALLFRLSIHHYAEVSWLILRLVAIGLLVGTMVFALEHEALELVLIFILFFYAASLKNLYSIFEGGKRFYSGSGVVCWFLLNISYLAAIVLLYGKAFSIVGISVEGVTSHNLIDGLTMSAISWTTVTFSPTVPLNGIGKALVTIEAVSASLYITLLISGLVTVFRRLDELQSVVGKEVGKDLLEKDRGDGADSDPQQG